MDRLPADTERLRALARSLVQDAAAADDVVQDALAAAVARPAGSVGVGWLRAAVRSLAVDRARSERARAQRERAAARRRTEPDVAETVERAELARCLYGAILALPEAMRDAVLLRYVDDLPPREIAAGLDVPAPTVKKRIERGLAQLREKLEAEHGPDGRWAVALLPLAGRDVVAPAAAPALAAWGVVAAVIVATGAVLALRPGARREPLDPVPGRMAAATDAPRVELDAVSAKVDRAALGADEAAVASDDEGPGPDEDPRERGTTATGLELLVLDASGDPAPRVSFEWTGERTGDRLRRALGMAEPAPLALMSGPDGYVRTGLVPRGAWVGPNLVPRDTRRVALNDVEHPERGRLVVVVPAVRLAGVVVDPDTKQPIAGARVWVSADVEALTTLDLGIELPYAGNREERVTDGLGRFAFDRAPTHPDFSLTVVRPKYNALQRLSVPAHDDLGMTIEALSLPERPARERLRVFGRVERADGSPAMGARVTMDGRETNTDATGAFEFESCFEEPLVAWDAAGRFVVGPAPVREDALSEAGSGPHVLVIPREMNRLIGQVVDGDGRPLEGLEVYVVDATRRGRYAVTLEKPERPLDDGREDCASATDSRGVFAFRSMLDRSYLIRVRDPRTNEVQSFPSVSTATTLERLVFDPGAAGHEVQGTVVDTYGAAIAGADLKVHAPTLRPTPGRSWTSVYGPSAATDDEGRFAFEALPRRGGTLEVQYDGDAPLGDRTLARIPLEDVSDGIRIVIDPQCEVVVRTGRSASEFSRVVWLDASGERTRHDSIHSDGRSGRRVADRRPNGTLPLMIVPASVSAIVLLRGDEEIERVPVRLDPTVRNELTL